MDLMAWPVLGRFLRWRHARTALQLPVLLAALIIVLDGLVGPQLAPKNLATVFIWVHYRGLVVLALLTAGNLFCMACPFMLPRNLLRRFVHPTRAWPRVLRGKWVAAILFAGVLFAYELFDLWATPWWTAWLSVAYFASALLIDSFFRGAAFCKYVCPLGQFNFCASLVSPLQVTVRDSAVCADCSTKDCIRGRGDLRGCELWLYQPRKKGNMDCTFCLDCAHACPYDNVGLSARLPAAELWIDPVRSGIGRFSKRPDLAALVVVFAFGALLNAFGMVSPVYTLQSWLAGVLGTDSEPLVLGLVFVGGLVVAPMVLLWPVLRLSGGSLRYVYALAPLGSGVWVAHYSFHFLSGFWTFLPVLQNFVADVLGSPLLGAPRWDLGALLPMAWLDPLEWGFIGLGWFGSLLVAWQLAQDEPEPRRWRALVPWVGLLTLLTLAAFWLMAQPMEMRGTFLGG